MSRANFGFASGSLDWIRRGSLSWLRCTCLLSVGVRQLGSPRFCKGVPLLLVSHIVPIGTRSGSPRSSCAYLSCHASTARTMRTARCVLLRRRKWRRSRRWPGYPSLSPGIAKTDPPCVLTLTKDDRSSRSSMGPRRAFLWERESSTVSKGTEDLGIAVWVDPWEYSSSTSCGGRAKWYVARHSEVRNTREGDVRSAPGSDVRRTRGRERTTRMGT